MTNDQKQHQPWLDRVTRQLTNAYSLLEESAAQTDSWLIGEQLLQPDITVCVVWHFTQYTIPDVIDETNYSALSRLSGRAERLPEFVSTPLD